MSTVTGDSAGPLSAQAPGCPRGHRSRCDRRWDRARWVLVAGWLAVAAAALVTGERTSTWQELQSQVATERVDTVRTVGGLSGTGTGFSLVELHWRQGGIGRTATVLEVRGRRVPREALPDPRTPVVRASPADLLRELQPGLEVEQGRHRSPSSEILGWLLPGWMGLLVFGLSLAGLVMLAIGPEPWRATRWAWFWLWGHPVGVVAFLLLSGPTPGVPRPRPGRGRLTGGWAFLLALLVAGTVGRPGS